MVNLLAVKSFRFLHRTVRSSRTACSMPNFNLRPKMNCHTLSKSLSRQVANLYFDIFQLFAKTDVREITLLFGNYVDRHVIKIGYSLKGPLAVSKYLYNLRHHGCWRATTVHGECRTVITQFRFAYLFRSGLYFFRPAIL